MRLPLRAAGEDGLGLVELSVAMALFTVAVLGLAGSMAASVKYVGSSRQRSAASAVATERLERVRNLGDSQLALYDIPAHSSDPQNPDNAVTLDGASFDTGSGTEPLVIDQTAGAVKHIDDPVATGTSEMYIYQYVTWVDDPAIAGAHNGKRITIVVSWRRAMNSGVASRIVFSSLVGPRSLTIVSSTPTPTPASTPSPSPTPSATPGPSASPGACDSDTTPPSGLQETIVSGAGAQTGYTNSLSVSVRLAATDDCAPISAQLSNDGTTFAGAGTVQSGVSQTVSWTVPAGGGTKTVSARFSDGRANTTSVLTAQIVVDQAAPTAPAQMRVGSCALSGSDRNATLMWDASTDANLDGYRVYRSIEGDAYTALGTTASTQLADTTQKSKSVRYFVRAYDRAGNESADSDVITFPKNAC